METAPVDPEPPTLGPSYEDRIGELAYTLMHQQTLDRIWHNPNQTLRRKLQQHAIEHDWRHTVVVVVNHPQRFGRLRRIWFSSRKAREALAELRAKLDKTPRRSVRKQ